MRTLYFFIFFCLLCASMGTAQTMDDLILMTEEFPPYNFREKGKLQGTSVDLIELILQKMNSKLRREDIQVLPWARAYKHILEKENTVLFVMTKTREREKLFKWVGPISTARNVLIAKKKAGIKIDSIQAAKKYRISAVRNDAGAQLVVSQTGLRMEDLEINANAIQSIQMLNAGRTDLFAYDENVAFWLIHTYGLSQENFETVFVIEEGRHYFAFHRNTPDELVEKIQKVLDELKAQGEYDQILKKYIK